MPPAQPVLTPSRLGHNRPWQTPGFRRPRLCVPRPRLRWLPIRATQRSRSTNCGGVAKSSEAQASTRALLDGDRTRWLPRFEGALSLLVGDHVSLNVDLKPLKTHGWRGFGTTFVVLGVLSEAIGIVGHVMANRRFRRFTGIQQILPGGSGWAGGGHLVGGAGDWLLPARLLGNRRNVETRSTLRGWSRPR